MRRVAVAMMAGSLFAGTAIAAKVSLAPADDAPSAPIGAKARAAHGPERLAIPAVDVGEADDPMPTQDPTAIGSAPQPAPSTTPPRG